MDKLYHSGSKGYCGDEDNGQTSAWYVFSAMGFYPVCPGVPEYAMGSPLFPKLTLHLPDGKNFTVKAEGNSPANRYIGKALLNESEFTRNYLTHRELTSGGELVLWMDSVPDSRRHSEGRLALLLLQRALIGAYVCQFYNFSYFCCTMKRMTHLSKNSI